MARRRGSLVQRQALASLGQTPMLALWQGLIEHPVAQVLLSHDDLRNRRRYLNAQATLQELLRIGAVPIVNENDTVSVDELKLGDNDNLAAAVATLVRSEERRVGKEGGSQCRSRRALDTKKQKTK